MSWLTNDPGLPVWALLVLLFIGCAASGIFGYLAAITTMADSLIPPPAP